MADYCGGERCCPTRRKPMEKQEVITRVSRDMNEEGYTAVLLVRNFLTEQAAREFLESLEQGIRFWLIMNEQ